MSMGTVKKPALIKESEHFGEIMGKFLLCHINYPKAPDSGGIDNHCPIGSFEHFSKCCGMFSLLVVIGDNPGF